VLTSQRVTDVILKAFKAMACSYGCMNNFTFGDEGMAYYETIAGGGGAGPGFGGCDGVQMHMTNTRITDPEILERHYPVSLRQFKLRQGSGGTGKWQGGEGVVRELEFLRPLQVGLLTERRALPPAGLLGGGDGARGENLLIKKDGKHINLGGKASIRLEAGDRCAVYLPRAAGQYQPILCGNLPRMVTDVQAMPDASSWFIILLLATHGKASARIVRCSTLECTSRPPPGFMAQK
jgi:5-oxoprolinase (ATP-hydrolysing)